ncbi:MAG: hypothetical protein IT359_01810 [Gemmatimonadaceae bacterium]|nr:hypothetical protein [Gemmatimonadaceae bacterium]
MNSSERADALIVPAYLIAFLLVATPAMDFVTSILPLRLGDIEWRFASVGLLSGFLLTPLLGVLLAMGVAAYAEHVLLQRILAIVNLVLGACFAVLVAFFVLDILQLRSVVQAEAKAAFESAASKAIVKHLSFVVASLVLGWRGLRASRENIMATPQRPRASVVIGE